MKLKRKETITVKTKLTKMIMHALPMKNVVIKTLLAIAAFAVFSNHSAAYDFNGDGQPDLAVANDGGIRVLLSACVSPDVPVAIVRGATTVTLSWPSPSTGFVLESTLSLSPPNWQLVGDTPTANNNRLEVALTLDQQRERYFRLHKP